jgi:hypothetical protein
MTIKHENKTKNADNPTMVMDIAVISKQSKAKRSTYFRIGIH